MQALFSVFLNATFYGSVMILLVLVLRLILRQAPRRILCILWLFVMARLLLPISIESKLSLQPRFSPVQSIVTQVPEAPNSPPVQVPVTPLPDVTVQTPVIPSPEITIVPDVSTSAQSAWELMDILPVVWFAVMGITFVYMAVSYSLLRHRLRDAVSCEKGLWESDRIPGAFMLGYLWPQIYLPTGLNPADRELIIAHEKAHIRRGDAWWKLLGMFCLCLHWYNPLVWLAYVLMSRDIETSCDEQVIRTMSLDQRKAYSYALLNSGKRMSGIFVSPMAFAEVNLKQRIKNVLSYRNPGIWITAVGIIVCACVVIFFMPDPTPEQRNISFQDSTQSAQSTESAQNVTEATGETVHTHAWQDATCSAPKTCLSCGATDGSAKEHTYVNRKCTGCGILLPTEELQFRLNPDQKSYKCINCLSQEAYVVIPATYNGLPVTTIGPMRNNAFSDIILPDSITTIADEAFSAEGKLLRITLPAGVTTIGKSAFLDCMHMTSITLSENLTTIGPYAFARCISLTQIHIPAGVTSIGEGAFQNCYQLRSITFGGTVAQWNAIEKGKDWIGTAPFFNYHFGDTIPATGVTCSDGFVPF